MFLIKFDPPVTISFQKVIDHAMVNIGGAEQTIPMNLSFWRGFPYACCLSTKHSSLIFLTARGFLCEEA